MERIAGYSISLRSFKNKMGSESMKQITVNLENEEYQKLEYTASRLGQDLNEFTDTCLKLGFLKFLQIM